MDSGLQLCKLQLGEDETAWYWCEMWRKRHLPHGAFPRSFPVFGPEGELLAQVESVAGTGAEIAVAGWAAASEVGLWSANKVLQTLQRRSKLGDAGSTSPSEDRLRFQLRAASPSTSTYLYLRTEQGVHYVQLGI